MSGALGGVDHQYVKVTSFLRDGNANWDARAKLCNAATMFDLNQPLSLERSASPLFPYETCPRCLLLLTTMAANGLELDLPGYLAVMKILEADDVRPTDERSEVR